MLQLLRDMDGDSLIDEINELFSSGETWKEGLHLEFKASKEKLSSDLWPSYSAFANTDGGIIVLGVEDNGRVSGVENIKTQLKVLTSQLSNLQKININLSAEPGMVEATMLSGKPVILLRVPKAQIHQKPVYLNGNPAMSFCRQNEQDTRCSHGQMEQMLRDKSTVSRLSRVIPNCSLSAIDSETLRSYRVRMQQYRPDHPWVTYDDIALLEALGAYCGPDVGDEEGLTYAGLLMFGRDAAIRRFFPRFNINYYEHDDDEGVAGESRWSNRITPDGTWNGNLYQFFFKVLPLITSTLAVPFSLNDDLTSRGVSGAHLAVREALANALVHADYEGVGGVNVHRYPSGLVLSNPGTLLVPYERLFVGGLSECRNPELQTMFQRIGVVEKAGSGVATILRGWAEQVLRIPEVREESQPLRVVWTLPFISLIPRAEEQQLRRKVGEKRYNRLNVMQRVILLLVDHQELSSHSEIHRLLPGVHPAEISKTLSFLSRSCYITATGNGPATRYTLPEFSDIPNNSADIPNNSADIPNNSADIPNNSGNIPDSAGELSMGLSDKRFSEDTILAVDAYKKRKRHTQTELEEIVLMLCSEHWMRLAELSEILNLKAEYLRSRVVQVLCRLNLLQRRYQGLKHTAQAYRKVH